MLEAKPSSRSSVQICPNILQSRDVSDGLWTLEGELGSRSSVKNGPNILQSRDSFDGLWTLEGERGSRSSVKNGPNILQSRDVSNGLWTLVAWNPHRLLAGRWWLSFDGILSRQLNGRHCSRAMPT